MKKIFVKATCFLFAIIITLLAVSSCQSGTTEKTDAKSNVHTVSFNSNGGTPISSVEVRDGQKVTEPNAPTRENYVFLYWEHNNRKWSFSMTNITEDITLSALWISANELFDTVPAENENEILISGFANQKSVKLLRIPEKINGKTVVGFTDRALKSIHDQHAESIIIPATVRSVGEESFMDINMVSIEFLGKLNTLGISSFEDCTMLKTVKLDKGLKTIPYRCFFAATALLTVDIPEEVEIIEENAFSSCTSLQTVVLPSTLKSIEDGAFIDADNLTVVFFRGAEEQFDAVEIAKNNNELLTAKIYFYSEAEPTEDGDFWHYDKSGTPILW